MVINQLLKVGLEKLSGREFSNPQLEVRLILSKLLNVDKTYIYAFGDREVPEEVADEFLRLVDKRSSGYPFQYLIGEKEFMGLDFYLEEGVLVPRPDTEILVEYVLEHIKALKTDNIKVLDLGIGSGAISLSIAYSCPQVYVYGVDIDDIPIRVSNINKERFGLKNVELLKGDLFQPLKEMKISFHIIASNPPYIPKAVIETLQDEVKNFEPRLALDGGEDGLDFYREISQKAKDFLVDKGLLIFEIGHDQGEAVRKIMEKDGYYNIEVKKDLQGLDRIVVGFK